MAARSRRLAGPLVVPTTTAVAFTAPATHYAVVKTVVAQHLALSDARLNLFIGASGFANQLLELLVGVNESRVLETFFVVGPNEQLLWSSTTGGQTGMSASLHGFHVLI